MSILSRSALRFRTLLAPRCCPVAVAAVAPSRSAGHSRWQNVKADKDAGTAQKRNAMFNITRLLRKAVTDGNGNTNPQTNVHLKAVFEKAKADSVPLKTLERMLAARSQDPIELYVVEVRGRGGICVLVQSNSPTKVKCRQDIANHVKKVGLEVAGVESAISRSFFAKKGCVDAAQDDNLPTLDRATELALELDCSEVKLDSEGAFVFECDPSAVSAVADGLRTAGVEVLDAGVRYEPFEVVEVNEETCALLRGLYDRLRENVDGVVNVFDNVRVA